MELVESQNKDPVDFVLVWDSKSELASTETSKLKRQTFENNLQQEGLILSKDTHSETGLNFVKLTAPHEVLKRYAEILKLRLPMKNFENVHEVHDNLRNIPFLNDVVEGVKINWNEFITKPFMYDQTKLPSKKQELTAVFSRDKEYLFDIERSNFFSPSIRSRVIEFILKRKRLTSEPEVENDFLFGIERALNDGIYTAAYPLHDGYIGDGIGLRHKLYQEWASFTKVLKFQPLDSVRDYFGVKVALYFAWLGFYTNLLIVPSIVGLFCFIYGISYMNTHIPSQEICSSNDSMCPLCDVEKGEQNSNYMCKYWKLKETCLHSQILSLFDNGSTVFFAVFMSIWAALFLELWKRYSTEITHRWDTTNFTSEEEHARPEYLEQLKHVNERAMNIITQTNEPKVPYWTMKIPGIILSASTVVLMVLIVLSAVIGVILYRMSMLLALSTVTEKTIQSNASLFISATGAAINLVCIMIINYLYGYLAQWLTELELNRTQSEYDDSLSLKIYVLQFVNYYASIIYVAFFKGKFIGHPGSYNRVIGYRQEECSPGGCLMELCVQMAIIFVGKQFIMSIVEYHLPKLWKLYNSFGKNLDSKQSKLPQWVRDFKLADWGSLGLFYEYLEMVIQYGFVTIFVSAFPLAPLCALINNIFELRLDAKKLLIHHRRPVAIRVRDIGIWLQIMESLGRISVITNALIIAFTSEFIPKLVYKNMYSNPSGSLHGYTNFTLSYFDPNDFEAEYSTGGSNINQTFCRYFDYRHHPDSENAYKLTDVYWHILAARLAFVVIFQNFVGFLVMAIKWIVPNMNRNLRDKIRRESYVTNEIIIRTELLKAQGKLPLDDESLVVVDNDNKHENWTEDERSPLRPRQRLNHSNLNLGDVTDLKTP